MYCYSLLDFSVWGWFEQLAPKLFAVVFAYSCRLLSKIAVDSFLDIRLIRKPFPPTSCEQSILLRSFYNPLVQGMMFSTHLLNRLNEVVLTNTISFP